MSKTKFTIEDLFNLSGAVIYNPDEYKAVSRVSIDTRKIKKGDIFIAIKGKKFDGHNFVRDAVKKGAGAVIISKRKLSEFDDIDIPIVTVPNTIKALGELASVKRQKLNYFVIGITGSNGKTTTKEFAATILAEKFKTCKTEANNNNNIGVPLTLLNAKLNAEVVVVELGTNHFGEIEYTAKIARPDAALITNIGTAHSQYLIDAKGILNEKLSLFEITKENGGLIFINIDDPLLRKQIKKIPDAVTFGFDAAAEIKGTVVKYCKDGFPKMRVEYGKRKIEFKLKLAGKANLQNVLNAVAVAIKLGLNNTQIKNGVKKLTQVKGRFEIIKNKNYVVINDAYNASPESTKAALESLAEFPAKEKIAVLGDMLELGKQAEKGHKSIATVIKKVKPDTVLLLGKNMKTVANVKGVNVLHFSGVKKLIDYLKNTDLKDAAILVKGSRAMRLDEVVNFLTEENE